MARHTAADRARDALALALLVGGVALFLFARARLGDAAQGRFDLPPRQSAVAHVQRYDRLARVGLGTAGAGLLLAVVFSLGVARRRPQRPPSID